MKILSLRAHATVDYVLVALFGLAPAFFQFGGIAATLSYAVAVVLLAISLMTAYPMGIAKRIPFDVHGAVELVLALAVIAMPFLFGFTEIEHARNFFLITGLLYLGVWAATDYHATEGEITGTPRRRPPVGPRMSNRPMI